MFFIWLVQATDRHPANMGIETTATSATILQTFFFTLDLLFVSVVAEIHARRWRDGGIAPPSLAVIYFLGCRFVPRLPFPPPDPSRLRVPPQEPRPPRPEFPRAILITSFPQRLLLLFTRYLDHCVAIAVV